MSPINLPFNNKINTTGGVSRAQNFSVTKLNQKKDIENAKVSVADINKPVSTTSITHGGSGLVPHTTSITHAGNDDVAVSSVAHMGQNVGTVDQYDQNSADDRRYQYMQGRIRKRKAREAEKEEKKLLEQMKDDKYLNIKTGVNFTVPGKLGLRRQFFRLKKRNPEAYKNLSGADREYFLAMVGKHASALRVGQGFGPVLKRKMKYKMEMDRRKGIISKEDMQDFKKMVDHLPN